jgi:hypothetical protein
MFRSRLATILLLGAMLVLDSCSTKHASPTAPKSPPQSSSLTGTWVMTIPLTPVFNVGSHSINGQDDITIVGITPSPGSVAGAADYVVSVNAQLVSADSAFVECRINQGGSSSSSPPPRVLRGTTAVQVSMSGTGGHDFAVMPVLFTSRTGDPAASAVAFALSAAYTNPQIPSGALAVALALTQSGTQLVGTATIAGGTAVPVTEGLVDGSLVNFKAGLDPDGGIPWEFTGHLVNGALQGTVDVYDFPSPWSLRMPWLAHR